MVTFLPPSRRPADRLMATATHECRAAAERAADGVNVALLHLPTAAHRTVDALHELRVLGDLPLVGRHSVGCRGGGGETGSGSGTDGTGPVHRQRLLHRGRDWRRVLKMLNKVANGSGRFR